MPFSVNTPYPNTGGDRKMTSQLFSFCIVQGDSMQPAYLNGDIIITHPVRQITVDDVIVFHEPMTNRVVVHRVIENNNRHFLTKGDANSKSDPHPLYYEQVIGKVWLRIPKIGYCIWAVQRRWKRPCPR